MGFSVLVVDDHPMVRAALRSAIESLTDDVVVLLAGSLEDAFRHVDSRHVPDLVLLDLNLPDACGTATIGGFRQRAPGIRVVAVSGDYDIATIQACKVAGASGFVPKTYTLDLLLASIRRVIAGESCFPDAGKRLASAPPIYFETRDSADPRVRAAPLTHPIRRPAREYCDGRHLGLTDRQRGVLKLMLQGLPNKAICRELALAEGTVKVHVSAVLRALGVSTRAQVVVAAVRSGIRFEEIN